MLKKKCFFVGKCWLPTTNLGNVNLQKLKYEKIRTVTQEEGGV